MARYNRVPLTNLDQAALFTPDDVMDGAPIAGPVIVYDDDHYYMGGVIAEKLSQQGHAVTLVTPAPLASAWTVNTLEQGRIQARLIDLGVTILANHGLSGFRDGTAELACAFTGRRVELAAAAIVLVTARLAEDLLYTDLLARQDEWASAGIRTVERIGDALAPGTIAAATFSGHRYARELDRDWGDEVPFLRENAELGPWS